MRKLNIQEKIKRHLIHNVGIICGSILFAMAYSWFLIPYKIAPGGVGGLSQILFHLFNLPVGISMIALNIPLFGLSFWLLGKRFGINSIYGMFTTAIFSDLLSLTTLHKLGIIRDLSEYTHLIDGKQIYAMLPPDQVYLAAIAGSVLLGLGLGIIFRFRGSTGGTDIPVAIVKQKFGVSIGTGYWIIESVIIFTIGIVFQNLSLIIWGYINLFITAKITDLASEGLPYVKGVYVISEKNDEIKEMIYQRINRGVTYLKAEGGYTGNQFNLLFCAMNRRQVSVLRDFVKQIDPQAFVLLTDVYDVMGYGFRSRSLDLQDKK
jgi:uncharacterized membrane-anchored protein YitT (DUF2179 family)